MIFVDVAMSLPSMQRVLSALADSALLAYVGAAAVLLRQTARRLFGRGR